MQNTVHSIIDNDLYKFTMQQAVCQLYPRAWARYEFINRGKTQFPSGFAEALKWELMALQNLQLQEIEKNFLLNHCYYLTPFYVDFLAGYRFDPRNEVRIIQEDGNLKVIVEGPWYRTILWEVPLMSMISELYFKKSDVPTHSREHLDEQDRAKATRLAKLLVKYADFGTRRRHSFRNHDRIVKINKEYAPDAFVGTSNVYLAMINTLKPIGTHAHEWFMFHAAKYGFHEANKLALQRWADVYQGELGIALSDTFTTSDFLNSFGTYFAKLFDGVRHDSGDPIKFAQKILNYYEYIHIDPMTKTIVFSDGLNVDKVAEIEKFCKGKIKTSYGIGTYLTNDVGPKALNMVIKMTACKPKGRDYPWVPTCKLSDVEGKHTGDPETIAICKKVLGI